MTPPPEPLATKPPAASARLERAGIVLLSAVAGYVDTAGYLTLYGLFTAHVTGNFVTAGAALAQRAPEGVVARLAVLPIFMAAVAATTLGARAVRRKGRSPLAPLLAAMTVALALFWAAGVLLRPQATSPDSWAVVTIGGAGVVAMGIQNALMREALGTSAPTTVMTGNLTQVTIDLVTLLDRGASDRPAAITRLKKLAHPVVGFIAGAALGAWLTGELGLWSIGLPTVAVGALAVAARLPSSSRAD